MQPKDRQKMCSNCDGRIPFDAEVCPYCAAEQAKGSAHEQHHQSLQDSLTSLYSPPYAGKSSGAATIKPEPPKEPMAEKRFNNSSISLGAPTIPADTAVEQHADEGKSSFWPILLLSVGGNLLTIGLLQLFFSDNGFLRLEWDSSYWFVYCLAAFPLFFLGFKKANLLR
ncbi:MAG: hypothetical protein HYX67_13195 [Candidatus Melainabacteria bacterium]|nr:hypothetical protein [Candidatus Melainabacteria bacterium]